MTTKTVTIKSMISHLNRMIDIYRSLEDSAESAGRSTDHYMADRSTLEQLVVWLSELQQRRNASKEENDDPLSEWLPSGSVIDLEGDSKKWWRCGNCGALFLTNKFKFCPECGDPKKIDKGE